MGIEQYRDRVLSRIQQAVTQSGVDLSSVPETEQSRLRGAIADGMLLELDSLLDEAMPKAPPEPGAASTASADTSHAEEILWQGRPFLSLINFYVVTSDRVRVFTGLLSKDAENVELVRVQDVDYHQGVSERLLNIGDITLHSADPSDPKITLHNVRDPERVSGIIRAAWLAARKRYGVRFREEM